MTAGAWTRPDIPDASLPEGFVPPAGRAGLARLSRFLLVLTVFCGGFVFIEPAPYEFVFALLFCAVLMQGAAFPPLLALPLACLALWLTGGLLAIAANGNGADAGVYLAISAYLALTSLVFAAIVSERPGRTSLAIRRAWTAAALITAGAGIAGYFHLFPGAGQFVLHERARGLFQDPNVFGPFLMLPALLLFQDILSAPRRRFLSSGLLLCVLLAAILLSFSRAAWGNLVASGALMAGLMFLTAPSNRMRIGIIGSAILGLCLAGALLAALLAIPTVSELFAVRAELTQTYDAGVSGRFGTQLRSLPALLERPFGFGPYAYGERYGLDPHNVYLNGFAAYGWLGGFAYLAFVLSTGLVGFRGLLIRTPWQGFLIAVYAAFAGASLEGLVIDIDHWRHYFLLAGLVWGFSAASFDYRSRSSAPA